MPARKNLAHSELVRQRIRTTQLLRRLQYFALHEKDEQGLEVKLNANEIRSIEILLRKSVPDLSAVQHSGEIVQRHTTELSDAELAHIAAGSSAGAATPASGTPDDSSVH